MANTIISAVLQILVFTLIPFIVYLIQKRQVKSFLSYIGLKKSNKKANGLAFLLAVFLTIPLLLLAMYNEGMRAAMTDPQSVTGAIRQMDIGFSMLVVIIVTAVFKTGLAEEIFFRGFLAKRFIALFGFQIGNLLQAIIFGIIHTLLFYFAGITEHWLFLMIIFIFPAIMGWMKGYLNEKWADGSIVPGWIAHATGNLMAYSVVAFWI